MKTRDDAKKKGKKRRKFRNDDGSWQAYGAYGLRFDQPFAEPEHFLNYEKSWLAFNWRVLREATDPDRNPLLDRVRFLAITASNLDEFFQKRVGALKKQILARVSKATVDGMMPREQLQIIREDVLRMRDTAVTTLHDDLIPRLKEIGIHLLEYAELDAKQRAEADRYYTAQIFPLLTPLGVDPGHPFPFISNLSLSLGVELQGRRGDWHFARVKVPPTRPRFVELKESAKARRRVFVPLEQIMSANIQSLFTGMTVVSVSSFRVTRSAEVDDYFTEAEDLMELIAEELRSRKYAPAVRVQVDRDLSPALRTMLVEELEIDEDDVYVSEGFLQLSDLFQIAGLDGYKDHELPRWIPKTHPVIQKRAKKSDNIDFFALIRDGDLLAHYPYHSFETSIVNFVRQAAYDPKVLAIKQTLYRTTEDSAILLALIEAAEMGKQVAVLVELKARFDEARNIELARRLEESGIHVTYGLVGLKTHCKTTLVIREEESGIRRYFHIGTGNYNPVTARVYEDLGLFSCDPVIGEDLTRLFNYLTGFAPGQKYAKLLVAPKYFRPSIEELIEFEIAEAKAGRPARILAKMNTLEDPRCVQLFYQASSAGVSIDLIVRGVCRLIPGRPGLSENIRVRSIVGRFLEHSRIYHFHHAGQELYFIGSGDLMRRNLDWRVEVITPVEQPGLREYLAYYLDAELRDQRQTWVLDADGTYQPLVHDGQDARCCHLELMEHAESRKAPVGWHPVKRD